MLLLALLGVMVGVLVGMLVDVLVGVSVGVLVGVSVGVSAVGFGRRDRSRAVVLERVALTLVAKMVFGGPTLGAGASAREWRRGLDAPTCDAQCPPSRAAVPEVLARFWMRRPLSAGWPTVHHHTHSQLIVEYS